MVSIAMRKSNDRSAQMVLDAPSQGEESYAPVVLKISGGKPMRMRARLVAEGTSWALGTAAWNEVAIYQRDQGDIAVSIKTFKKAATDTDVFHAEVFPNFEEACGFLESFDPSSDMSAGIDASDRSVSGAEIALRAAALRQKADDVVRRYRSLVGELLFRLDASE